MIRSAVAALVVVLTTNGCGSSTRSDITRDRFEACLEKGGSFRAGDDFDEWECTLPVPIPTATVTVTPSDTF